MCALYVQMHVRKRRIYQLNPAKNDLKCEMFHHFLLFQTPLNEVVEPPDFEDLLLQNQPFNENDPKSKMLEFPDDDIEVTTIPRQCRTVKPCFPKDTG